MQRLTDRLSRRFGADRDRGASAVLVGLLLVPLLGFAAIAVDIAAMHADRQMLQTGADAAALAVAQDCARGECGDSAATASSMATANDPFGGPAEATITRLDTDAGIVTVRTDSSREHFFAQVVGFDDAADLAAAATARWGVPARGAGVLPYVLSYCELIWQAGASPVYEDGVLVGVEFPEDPQAVTFEFTKTSDSSCTGPSGNVLPGGFGWLTASAGCTGPTVEAGGWVPSAPGESPPNGCSPADFNALRGETVLIPVFDVSNEAGGANGEYRILGFAAFTLLEYEFTGQYVSPGGRNLCRNAGLDPQARCLQGTFERFVDASGDYELDPDGPQLGVGAVELTLTEN